jgi:hypothetical protein
MKLTDLLLNRWLYKDNLQNLETKDSSYNAGNVVEAEVPAIASGGAAQDINTSNVFINGAQLEPGTFPQTVLDVSNWGWGQTCAFSSTDLDTVSWGAGVFKSADGTSYSISAGNTGNMAAKTYVYLDLNVSDTAYQITTTPATAVGIGKVLIAVANPDTASATYNLSEATQIVGDNILANSINASKITTGQLIVGTNVGLGTAQDSSGVTTIIGNTVTTGFVNALSITAGSVAAEDITGTYITGKIIRTASSGLRIQLDGTDAQLLLMRDSTTFATLEPLYDGSSGSNGFNLLTPDGYGISVGSGGSADFTQLVGLNADIDISGSDITYSATSGNHIFAGTLIPISDGGWDLGDSTGNHWGNGYFKYDVNADRVNLTTGFYVNSILQPTVYKGYVSGTTISRDNNSFTASNPSTGNYTITHNLDSGGYTVNVTAVKAAGTGAYIAKIESLSADSFNVTVFDDGGTARDGDFMFTLFL